MVFEALQRCLTLFLGAGVTVGVVSLGPLAFKVYRAGLRATALYLTKVPSRFLGYVVLAFRQKFTFLLAVLTAFRGTIVESGSIFTGEAGVKSIVVTFAGELWNQILLAPTQLANGLMHFLDFLGAPGVCGKLVSTDELYRGLWDVWTGLAAVIIIVSVYTHMMFRVRGRRVNNLDITVFLLAVFGTATAIQAGVQGTPIWDVLTTGQSLAEQLSALLDGTQSISNSSTANRSLS